MSKKTTTKPADTAKEPGFFSDYGYGKGTAITLHDPPQKPKGSGSKAVKNSRPAKIKRK